MRRITKIFEAAREQLDAPGAREEFVRRLHLQGGKPDEELTRLKEDQELGLFAEKYNAANKPALVWARRNPPGSGLADFTVWNEDQGWSRDLELTSAWEEEDAFPKSLNNNSGITIDLNRPKEPLPVLRDKLQRAIEKNLKRHAGRKKYPPYWIAIYANFSFEAYEERQQPESDLTQGNGGNELAQPQAGHRG